MFESVWKKVDELFAAVDRETEKIFRSDGSTRVMGNGVTYTEHNGHLDIKGDFKTLTINGRRVRFKE